MSRRQAKPDASETKDAFRPLAVIAGNGSLPLAVAEAAARTGRQVHMIGIRGETDPAMEHFPHAWVKWGEVGKLFATLEDRGCRDLVIIGGVRRPDLAKIRFDSGVIRNLPRLLRLGLGGDDTLLSTVVRFFEEKGYRVHGAGEVAPELLACEGSLGTEAPSPESLADIERGFAVVEALGRFDIGQAAVVAGGRVLAVEASEGTDAMLARCAVLRREQRSGVRSGVLVKAPKPGQEQRVDQPTIGPDTVRHCVEARLAGIAVAAGLVLVANRSETVAAADEQGLFLYGVRLHQSSA
jgi:DUF1009 family protein